MGGKRITGNTAYTLSDGRESQPLPLRGTSFQRKEGDLRMPLSLYRHFECKREIFFVRGQEKWEESG